MPNEMGCPRQPTLCLRPSTKPRGMHAPSMRHRLTTSAFYIRLACASQDGLPTTTNAVSTLSTIPSGMPAPSMRHRLTTSAFYIRPACTSQDGLPTTTNAVSTLVSAYALRMNNRNEQQGLHMSHIACGMLCMDRKCDRGVKFVRSGMDWTEK